MPNSECFTRQSVICSYCLCSVTNNYYCLFKRLTNHRFSSVISSRYKMKTFSVVVLLAIVVIFVFMADSATIDEDYDDLNTYEGKYHDIFRFSRSAKSGTEKYTKITKHPLYVFLKGLFKIITKIFSSDAVQLPDMTYDNNT